MDNILSNCTSGGCGAKIGPGELASLLSGLPIMSDPNLLVGFSASDDGAVYQLDGERAVISTADFFSPMVDDAFTFGKIAAANALSDVYAMGGTPVMAINLVCYPEKMDLTGLGEILRGGVEKIQEAGALLCGGHSIYDKEIKYGLSVTGLVHPRRIWKNDTPCPGDRLILTKPLGVGIVMAAKRGEAADNNAVEAALYSMQRLNKYAADKLRGFPVNACTDVTGFGLLVHAGEMAGENTTVVLHPSALPYIPQAYTYAGEYLLTAAGQRNRNHMARRTSLEGIPFELQELMLDPQTSGGLLVSIPEACAEQALAAVREVEPSAAIIGEITRRGRYPVLFG